MLQRSDRWFGSHEAAPRVLIITGETGQFRYYLELALRLRREGLQVAFCCDRDDPGVGQTIASGAAAHDFAYFKHEGDREPGEFSFRDKLRWWFRQRLNRAEVLPSDLTLASVDYMRRYHFFRLCDANRILKSYRPDAVVLGEDGIAVDIWAIAAARDMGIRIVIVPYGMADSGALIWKGVEQKARDGELITTASPGGRFIAERFPRWVKSTDHGEAILLPPAYIIALEEMAIHLRDPWCFQGGDADVILGEGPLTRARYLADGVPSEKIRDVGSVYCDVLHDAIQRREDNRHAFERSSLHEEGRLRILFAVPPSDHVGFAHRAEFASLADFIVAADDLIKSFPSVTVTYSFHPRILPDDRKALAERNIVEDERFVVEQIADCDALLACGSSVSRWAIAGRKLVFNVDVYRFGVNDFPDIPGFFYLSSLEDLRQTLLKLISQPAEFGRLVGASEDAARLMGLLDGRAASRLAREIRAVCAMKPEVPRLG